MEQTVIDHRRHAAARPLAAGLVALVMLGLVGCAQREVREPPSAPPVESATPWQTVIAQAKAYTQRIGFQPTDNFTRSTTEQDSFPYCGRALRLVLPYSYEDPAIEWLDSLSEQECRNAPPTMDYYYGESEALGEIATPVTPSMIASGVPRMIYLVVHEDCHDQFALPYGIEEPLCELFAYRGMLAISEQPGPWSPSERRAIRRFAQDNIASMPVYIRLYEQVAALHARHARGALSEQELLRERAAMFARAEAALELAPGSMNNIALANRMTYARHYPAIEQVFERVGSDPVRLLAFFQEVDVALADAESALGQEAPGRTVPKRSAPRQRTAAPVSKAGATARSAAPGKRATPTRPAQAAGRSASGTIKRPDTADGRNAERPDPLAEIQAAEAATLATAMRLLALQGAR